MTSSSYLITIHPKVVKVKPHPDTYIIGDEGVYDIELIRKAVGWIYQKPFTRGYKILFIKLAEKLSIEAQNTLLKTLEEPPSNNLIILTTNNAENVLPTVRSRCHKLNVSELEQGRLIYPPDDPNWLQNFEITTTDDLPKEFPIIYNEQDVFQTAEKLSKLEREELQIFLDEWIHQLMNEDPQKNHTLANALLNAKEYLTSNTNIQLTLEVVLLTQTSPISLC